MAEFCQFVEMKDETDIADPRQAAILTAAMKVMGQYGYRRSSMEDIARAAGMSRPALYQFFRNKEDIARRMVGAFYATAARDVAAALSGEGTIEALLVAAFEAKGGEALREIMECPHGEELLDVKAVEAGEIAAEGRARLVCVIAEWLEREAAAGRIRLELDSAEEADVLLNALEGVKRPPFDVFVRRRDALARVLARGLVAGV